MEAKVMLEDITNKILEKIEKETWDSYCLKTWELHCNEFDKEIRLFFENGKFGLEFVIFSDEIGEEWLEKMVMGIDMYMNESDGRRPISYGKILEEPETLKKIYRIAKEELEYVFQQNKELRMKYMFHHDEMLQVRGYLKQALKKIKKREEGK